MLMRPPTTDNDGGTGSKIKEPSLLLLQATPVMDEVYDAIRINPVPIFQLMTRSNVS